MIGGLNSKNKFYKGDNLAGIEYKKSILNVKENRASFMKNLLYSDGILKKRKGWRELYHFTDDFDGDLSVNGIFEYKGKEIFHAGNYLFEGNGKIENCFLPNYESYGFENGELLYIVCCESLYVYDGETVTDIYDSKYTHVPVTTVDISPISKEATHVLGESDNLVTSRRKNTLIGVREVGAKYVLDGHVDNGKPLNVKTKMRVKLESTEENVCPYNAIYDEEKRLNTDNMAGIMGISQELAEKLFSGVSFSENLSVVGEIDIFLKSPIKITSAVFFALGATGVPRMTFLCRGETVYDTATVSESSELDLTSVLKDKVIDEIRFYGNYSIGIIKEVSIYGRELYEGYVEIVHSAESFEFGKSISPASVTDVSGKPLSLSQNLNGTFSAGCTLYVEKGINGQHLICFHYVNVSDSSASANVTVEYSVRDSEKLKCNIGEICKTDTGKDILSLSDGKNLYLSSNKYGFSYMPSHLKTEFDEITALCSKEGTVLGVFSKNQASSVKISTVDGETAYTLQGHSLQGGAINQQTTKTVNGDILSLSSDGVFGSVGNETHRTRRGENIKAMLPENKEKAVAVEHNGCYLLFIDGCVFVADTRFKNYESNRLDSAFEYEWWYLDNIYARCVSKINGEIYIGRDDGRVVKFHDGFCDVLYKEIKDGSYLFDKNQQGVSVIYLDKSLGIGAYDSILLSDCYSFLASVEGMTEYDGKTVLHIGASDFWTCDGNFKLYPEMELYLKNQDGALTKAKCTDVDGYTQAITVDIGENTDTYVEILVKNQNEVYKLEAEDDRYIMVDKYGCEARLVGVENATVLWETNAPVSVEYESAPLLRNGECKYLYEISIDLSKESCGIVTLEYETDKVRRQAELEYEKAFDFNSFDFSGLCFNSSLKKSHRLRTFERNLDYVILKIKHSEDEAFGLKSFGLVYG